MFPMKPIGVFVSIIFLLVSSCSLNYARPIDYNQLRHKAAKRNATCIIVFGDSSVDPGNNNRLRTQTKSNFLPYGKDFVNGQPSGRFCNGRLVTDFIAEAFGYTKLVKAFLDPTLTKNDLLHGVSFASAGSGYDDLTANISEVLPISKQLEYFRHYKIRLRSLVGQEETDEIIKNGVYILSMGDNDFLVNYYFEPTRPKQHNIGQYQDYLISRMLTVIKEMQYMGARNIFVAGVTAFGCMPLVKTLRNKAECDVQLNNVAYTFNTKIQKMLKATEKASIKMAYFDIYTTVLDAIENPKKYGFVESLKGCCGSGTYEFGNTCKNLRTCADRTKYVFWDAIHPTERMYKILADELLQLIANKLF